MNFIVPQTMHKSTVSIIGVSFLWMIFFGCKPQKNNEAKLEAQLYIDAHTTGVVSKRSTIRVLLTIPVENGVLESNSGRFFEITPSTNGEIKWLDNRTIEFRPDEFLKSGTIYKVNFNLKTAYPNAEDPANFPFEFQTIDQGLDLEVQNMEPYDLKNFKYQRIKGVLNTYDFAEDEKVEASLKAREDGKSYHVTWEHVGDGTTHYFFVDSVLRGESPKKLLLQYNSELIGGKTKGEKEFVLPSISDFKVLDVKILNEPDQQVEILFSDPISPEQNLKGLIYLKKTGLCKIRERRK